MSEIPIEIGDGEILVRFVYNRDFTKKILRQDKIITKNIFLPYKGGVSLQRHPFISENSCKTIAKNNSNIFVGFLLFTKAIFDNVVKDYKIGIRKSFEAKIIATPLDEKNNYRKNFKSINSKDSGNPTHCDLIYVDPAITGEESTNVAMRSFSRKLAKACAVAIDPEPESLKYKGLKFKQAIKECLK